LEQNKPPHFPSTLPKPQKPKPSAKLYQRACTTNPRYKEILKMPHLTKKDNAN